MGINLAVTTDSWGVDDQSWLGSRLGMDQCRSITLNVALFTADHYPNGFIPSGTLLGIVTATGLYGPYDDTAVDGRQVARGHLFSGVQVARDGIAVAKSGAALFWMGVVKTAKLPNFTGTANAKGELDANARADLAAHIRYED